MSGLVGSWQSYGGPRGPGLPGGASVPGLKHTSGRVCKAHRPGVPASGIGGY